jgi:acyl-CoA thioesterase FadM
LSIRFKNQILWNNGLQINLKVRLAGARIIFDYAVNNITLKNESANAQIDMTVFDKDKGRAVKPQIFIRMIKNDNNTSSL